MPRVTLAVQQIGRAGIIPAYVAAEVTGNAFANSGVEFIHVKNGGVGACAVTVLTQRAVDGQVVTNRIVSVANGADKMIGPFPSGDFNTPLGEVQFNYDEVTSVTVGVFRA